MPTAYRNTYINWLEKRLQIGEQNDAPFVLPEFVKYENVPFRFYLVELADDGFSFNRVNISNLTLIVSIHASFDTATPAAQQATWTKDTTENTFSGELDLNTAGISAAVGSATSVSAYFQITAIDSAGGRRVLYQENITIANSVVQPTTTSPDVTQTYYTAAETDGLFLKSVNGAGVQLTLISPSGNFQRIIGVDDEGQAIDTILPT